MPENRPDDFLEDDEALQFAAQIFQLARNGDAEVLSRILARGFPCNMRNDKGDSLLMLAAYNGNEPAVIALLQHGADPNIANDLGQTPLAAVSYKGNMSIAKHLLAYGARNDAPQPGGRTALMMAAMFDRVEMLEFLLSLGANPTYRDGSQISALDLARAMNATQAVSILQAALEQTALAENHASDLHD
ncbi:MAG TPA: ankyrin repeat domain-containing protein [Afipia sp.]